MYHLNHRHSLVEKSWGKIRPIFLKKSLSWERKEDSFNSLTRKAVIFLKEIAVLHDCACEVVGRQESERLSRIKLSKQMSSEELEKALPINAVFKNLMNVPIIGMKIINDSSYLNLG